MPKRKIDDTEVAESPTPNDSEPVESRNEINETPVREPVEQNTDERFENNRTGEKNKDGQLMGLSVETQLAQYEQLYLAHYLGLLPNKGSGDYTASNAVAVARAAVKARMT